MSTAVAVPGQKVYLDRMVIDVDAVGFNGASYAPTALAAVEGQKVRSEDGWAEVASMETDVDGAYRFDGLPMVDGNDKPYLYRVRSYMPDGKEWVAINVGSDENNDSDWGEAANSVVGAGGRVGITPAMSVLGAFQTVRTTPNAYGQKFNLLVPYNWVPEDGRLGRPRHDRRRRRVAHPRVHDAVGHPPVLREAPADRRRAPAVDGGAGPGRGPRPRSRRGRPPARR